MGKLVKTGASIECDRSGKFEQVTDEKAIAFYEKFLHEKKPGECMFAAVLITHEGERRVQYETLGPSGIKAVNGYLDKIMPPKKRVGKSNGKDTPAVSTTDPDKKTEGDKQGEAAAQKTESKTESPPDPEPEPDRDAGATESGDPPPPETPVSEDDMWDDEED